MAEFVTIEYLKNYTNEFYLRKNPQIIVGIIGAYLLFVYYVGPWLMKDRPAFNLKKVLICYNLFQVAWCAIGLVLAIKPIITVDYTCQEPERIEEYPWMYHQGYTYFLMKLVDLMDTIFFVLRKKKKQISYLHVYHHVVMCLSSYYFIYFLPSPKFGFALTVNVIVHLLMYGYYLLTAWVTNHQKLLWWKKHITQLQLCQFAMNFFVYGQMLFRENCEFPVFCIIMVILQNVYLTCLFGQFYYSNYITKVPDKIK